VISRRKKSRKKPPNGHTYPKKRVFDNRKNGFLVVRVGKATDFVQDWVRGLHCGFFEAFLELFSL
jgi:hypothetical protein